MLMNRKQTFSPKFKRDFVMACHTQPLTKKNKKQAEVHAIAHPQSHSFKNVELGMDGTEERPSLNS